MGLLASLSRDIERGATVERASSSFGLGLLEALGAGVPSSTGLTISQGTAVSVSPVYAAVTIRARDVSRCRPRLLPVGGSRSETPITDHPVARLFRRPNRIQTWTDFATQMHVAFLLRGNAYAIILRDRRGNPLELIPINPDQVALYEAPDGSLFYRVSSYGLFLMAVLKDLPPAIPQEDVIHIRGVSFNILTGLSTIGLARDSIGVAMGLQQQQARFMAQGARPGGVLESTKKLTQDTANRLRDQWQNLRAGIQNVGNTAILEDGVQWKPMQLTSVDLQFIDQLKLSIEDIGRFFGIPLYKLAGEIPRGVKIAELDQAYVNGSIMPDLDIWEEKFEQTFDLDAEKIKVDFDERRLLRADEATRINNQRLKVMTGLETQNEARDEEGRAPMDGGDVLLRPVNLAAAGSDATGTAPDGAGHPADGKLPEPATANDTIKD